MNAASDSAAPAPRASKRKRALLALATVVALSGAGWAGYHFTVGRWHESTDDAYVQGNIVGVAPQAAGTVVSIAAEDGMRVEAGQVLVRLDPTDAQVAYDQAVANLATSVRQARGFFSAVDAGQAEIRAREVAIARARADVARREGLVASGAVSAEELAHARNELAAAQAALANARGNLARNRALVDATTLRDQPQVQAAAAQLRAAYLALQRMEIVAPVSGYVAQRHVQLGQRVQPGTSLMTVIPLEQVWVEANFKETQLGRMRLGQPVELHADVYGKDVTYTGRLASLGLGTGSAFSLLPAQNASGNWIKIVQRVPVRVEIDARQLREHPLRIGLSMHADVDLHDADGPVLPAAAPAKPLLSTSVYARQLQEAQARIDAVIRDNLPGARHG